MGEMVPLVYVTKEESSGWVMEHCHFMDLEENYELEEYCSIVHCV